MGGASAMVMMSLGGVIDGLVAWWLLRSGRGNGATVEVFFFYYYGLWLWPMVVQTQAARLVACVEL